MRRKHGPLRQPEPLDEMPHRAKVPVSVTLSEDPVREACRLTSDRPKTVETRPTTYSVHERSKRAEEQRGINAAIAATNDYGARFGLPGEDYSPV